MKTLLRPSTPVAAFCARGEEDFTKTAWSAVGDFLSDAYLRAHLVLAYCRRFGRFPNLFSPQAFSERLLIKMMFDRDPQLTVLADKFQAREFVRSRLPEDYLPRLYGAIGSPTGIHKLVLPPRFVMKPSHLSGRIKFVRGPDFNIEELKGLAVRWLATKFYYKAYEWCYKNITPRILFEEWLGEEGIPVDYKFFCFDGEPRFFQVDKGRFGDHRRNFYDMKLNFLPFRLNIDHFAGPLELPPNFQEMVGAARKLSRNIDFVRVDMYNINGRPVIGELTNYPGAGTDQYDPIAWDRKIGDYWKRK